MRSVLINSFSQNLRRSGAVVVRKKGTDGAGCTLASSHLKKLDPILEPNSLERRITGRNKMDPALPKVVGKQVWSTLGDAERNHHNRRRRSVPQQSNAWTQPHQFGCRPEGFNSTPYRGTTCGNG